MQADLRFDGDDFVSKGTLFGWAIQHIQDPINFGYTVIAGWISQEKVSALNNRLEALYQSTPELLRGLTPDGKKNLTPELRAMKKAEVTNLHEFLDSAEFIFAPKIRYPEARCEESDRPEKEFRLNAEDTLICIPRLVHGGEPQGYDQQTCHSLAKHDMPIDMVSVLYHAFGRDPGPLDKENSTYS